MEIKTEKEIKTKDNTKENLARLNELARRAQQAKKKGQKAPMAYHF